MNNKVQPEEQEPEERPPPSPDEEEQEPEAKEAQEQEEEIETEDSPFAKKIKQLAYLIFSIATIGVLIFVVTRRRYV